MKLSVTDTTVAQVKVDYHSVTVQKVTGSQRPLRVDAARNAELLIRTAWRAFQESGVEVSLEEVAKRAGVGVATLYRRFPSKDDLLLAVLEWRYSEEIAPAFEKALVDDDAWRAMATAMECALSVAASARGVIRAARDPAGLLAGLKSRYLADLTTIVQRAQDAGVVRDDLTTDDIRMMLFMMLSSVRMITAASTAWRRSLGLLLDGLRPSAATPLPPLDGESVFDPGELMVPGDCDDR
jgi:AcrR family transcriptional regulator